VGYGLVPSVELAQLAGCDVRYDENLGGFVPVRKEVVRTTVPEVLCAGDSAGIGGSAVAYEEGRIAGVLAAMDVGKLSTTDGRARARPLERRLQELMRFRTALDGLYSVGSGIHELVKDDTVVCRCEEVTAAEIEANLMEGGADPSSIKNLTRVGMGRCQGRYCSRQVASIVARHAGKELWEIPRFTPRPPIKPVPINIVAEAQPEEEPVAEVG
jgi:hydrogen cyanide synthase HcnB